MAYHVFSHVKKSIQSSSLQIKRKTLNTKSLKASSIYDTKASNDPDVPGQRYDQVNYSMIAQTYLVAIITMLTSLGEWTPRSPRYD